MFPDSAAQRVKKLVSNYLEITIFILSTAKTREQK